MMDLYQCVKHPDGTWGVVQLIASFVEEDRPRAYASEQNVRHQPNAVASKGIDRRYPSPPHAVASDVPQAPRREIEKAARIGLVEASTEIKKVLPKLFEEFPKGFNADLIRTRFNYSYNSALELLRYLHAIGAGQFVYANGVGGSKIFISPDIPPPTANELTENQFRVLSWLRQKSDRYGLSQPDARSIASEANVALGSVAYVIGSLEKKGFLTLAKPGSPGVSPPTYQITDKANDTAAEVPH